MVMSLYALGGWGWTNVYGMTYDCPFSLRNFPILFGYNSDFTIPKQLSH